MSEDDKNETGETSEASAAEESENEQSSSQSGPTFNESPDPLAGVKKGASDVMDSMEGKTVSMKTYVGTIIAVIVLMLLARCGG